MPRWKMSIMMASKRLLLRTTVLFLLSGLISFIACHILRIWGLKVLMICGAIGAGFFFIWVACWLNDNCKLETSKILIFILIYVGIIMGGCSFYLAYIERNEIAEGLAKAALIELVAPAVMLLLKSLFENISKHNTWPDKEKKKDNTRI